MNVTFTVYGLAIRPKREADRSPPLSGEGSVNELVEIIQKCFCAIKLIPRRTKTERIILQLVQFHGHRNRETGFRCIVLRRLGKLERHTRTEFKQEFFKRKSKFYHMKETDFIRYTSIRAHVARQ
jgi:hypothetical protein